MVFLPSASVLSAVLLAASPLVAGNPIIHSRKEENNLPIDKILDPGMNKGKCNDLSWDENRKKIWDSGNGKEFLDAWIDKNDKGHGATNGWPQSLYSSIFPSADQSGMSCISYGADCDIEGDCKAFQDKGNAGAFYILKSVKNFHLYLAEYEKRTDWLRGKLLTDVDTIAHDFAVPAPKAGSLLISTAMAGSLGIAATGLGAIGPQAPAMAIAGSMVSIFGPKIEAMNPPPEDRNGDTTRMLQSWINSTVDAMADEVKTVRRAVFGGPGGNQYTEINDIYKVKDYKSKHPITAVFGDGRWLNENPTAGLEDFFNKAYSSARQILAFNALKSSYDTHVIINERDNDEKKCNEMKNNVWDKDAKPYPYCYGMMWLDGKGQLKGGINERAEPLWDIYGLDKLKTYRNIFDCWHKNSGEPGKLDTNNKDDTTGLQRCTFSMDLKKGSWVDDNNDCYGGATIALDTGFLNFPVASDDYQKKRTNWPHEGRSQSLFCNK
ncbi:unnamed protein product [Periconia digitata]|uniref:Killer toxin subunits alpha/beta n=1 Tax=Periconia digitata TaxID=1303443 RepID=A0A9W4UUC7_9PLEO|nr:unnamed protein product [Periconia digitata]